MLPKAVPNTRDSSLGLPALDLGGRCPGSVHTPRNRSQLSSEDSSVSIQTSSLCSGLWGELSQAAEGDPHLSWELTWDPTRGRRTQQLEKKG